MVVYNFKKMAAVPPADDFIDIILTRTQVKKKNDEGNLMSGMNTYIATSLLRWPIFKSIRASIDSPYLASIAYTGARC